MSAEITPEKEASLRAEVLSQDGVEQELDSEAAIALCDLLGETKEHGQEELLSRVLRACEYVVPKAAHVLLKILRWRADKRLPQGINDPNMVSLFERAAPYWPVGFAAKPSADGCVMEIWRVGQFWPTELLACLTSEEIENVWLIHMERGLTEQAKVRSNMGKQRVNGVILVFDLNGMAGRHLNSEALSQLSAVLKLSQQYYVENVKSILVLNAGTVFATAWSVIKTVLHANTVAKVSVHSDAAIDALTERMGSADRIPNFLGGKDESTKIGKALPSDEGLVTVKAAETHFVVIDQLPSDASSMLQVMFETEEAAMGFGVYWYPAAKKGKEVELVPMKKYDSHVAPLKVEVPRPEGEGIIRLAFDNENNSWGSRKVWVEHSWKSTSA